MIWSIDCATFTNAFTTIDTVIRHIIKKKRKTHSTGDRCGISPRVRRFGDTVMGWMVPLRRRVCQDGDCYRKPHRQEAVYAQVYQRDWGHDTDYAY